MDRKHVGFSGVLLGVAILIFCTLLWRPERQIRLHQRHFLQAVEKRDWPRFSTFIADTYSDRWQHDKKFLLDEPRQVFQHFLLLSIQAEEVELVREPDTGVVTERLKLEGSGSPVAQMVMQTVNGLSEPFVFHWKKQNWKPWAWQLVRIDHPVLQVPEF